MRFNLKCAAITAALCLSTAVPRLHAGTITNDALLTETMMETQSFDSLILYQAFGPDMNAAIHYTTNTDPGSGTFWFATDPGQSYMGMSLSLFGAGHFDSTLDEYLWAVTGQVGGQDWNGSGALQWVGDPDANPCFNVTLGGKQYKVCASLDVSVGNSDGDYTFTGPDGKQYGPYHGHDVLQPDHTWKHTIDVPTNPITPDGKVTFIADAGNIPGLNGLPDGGVVGGGLGTFTTTFTGATTVPEPSTLALAGLGGVLIAVSRTLKRRAIANTVSQHNPAASRHR